VSEIRGDRGEKLGKEYNFQTLLSEKLVKWGGGRSNIQSCRIRALKKKPRRENQFA